MFRKKPRLSHEEILVLRAALEYVRGVENPAPNSLYLRILRDRLAAAVHEYEVTL